MQIRGYKQESAKENKAKKGADAKKRKVKKAAPEPTVDIDALLSDNSILTKVGEHTYIPCIGINSPGMEG